MTSLNLPFLSQKFSVSVAALQIYIEILAHGELTEENIVSFLSLPKTSVSKGIDELLKRDLVFSYSDRQGISHYKSFQSPQFNPDSQEIALLESLEAIISPRQQGRERLGILRYEGWEGIRQIYLEVLAEAIRTQENILAFESIPNKEESQIGAAFLETYLQKRIENKVIARVITSDTAASREYEKHRNPDFTFVKIIPHLHLKGTLNVVGDLVMSYSISPAQGSLRRDPIEAHDLKQIFDLLWR